MGLLFFGGRHRYPGETVPWSEYFGEWLEHPILAGAMLLCMIWMFIRIYTAWKNQKEEREEQERQRELWGFAPAEQEEEKKPSYEDTYLEIPPSHRVPDGETPYQGRKGGLFTKLYVGVAVFALGLNVGIAGLNMDDTMMLLVYLAILVGVAVFLHLPKDWMKRSFEEDEREKKGVDWKGVKRFLLPFAVAFGAGIIAGLFFVSK